MSHVAQLVTVCSLSLSRSDIFLRDHHHVWTLVYVSIKIRIHCCFMSRALGSYVSLERAVSFPTMCANNPPIHADDHLSFNLELFILHPGDRLGLLAAACWLIIAGYYVLHGVSNKRASHNHSNHTQFSCYHLAAIVSDWPAIFFSFEACIENGSCLLFLHFSSSFPTSMYDRLLSVLITRCEAWGVSERSAGIFCLRTHIYSPKRSLYSTRLNYFVGSVM